LALGRFRTKANGFFNNQQSLQKYLITRQQSKGRSRTFSSNHFFCSQWCDERDAESILFLYVLSGLYHRSLLGIASLEVSLRLSIQSVSAKGVQNIQKKV